MNGATFSYFKPISILLLEWRLKVHLCHPRRRIWRCYLQPIGSESVYHLSKPRLFQRLSQKTGSNNTNACLWPSPVNSLRDATFDRHQTRFRCLRRCQFREWGETKGGIPWYGSRHARGSRQCTLRGSSIIVIICAKIGELLFVNDNLISYPFSANRLPAWIFTTPVVVYWRKGQVSYFRSLTWYMV